MLLSGKENLSIGIPIQVSAIERSLYHFGYYVVVASFKKFVNDKFTPILTSSTPTFIFAKNNPMSSARSNDPIRIKHPSDQPQKTRARPSDPIRIRQPSTRAGAWSWAEFGMIDNSIPFNWGLGLVLKVSWIYLTNFLFPMPRQKKRKKYMQRFFVNIGLHIYYELQVGHQIEQTGVFFPYNFT